MMKHIALLLCIFSLVMTDVWAQAKGNSNYERQTYDNLSSLQSNRVNQSYNQQNITNKSYNPQATNAYFINDSTFVIEANTMMNVKANSYVAILSITQIGSTLDSTNMLMNQRIKKFKDGLPSSMPKNEVFIDFISLVPTYEYAIEKKLFSKNANEIPSGYKLSKALHIAYDKPEQLDEMMLSAAKGEIYDLVKVDYVVEDIEGVYDSLRDAATNLILKKKKTYEKLGASFAAEFIVVADDIVSTYPIERYKSYQAYSSSSLGYDKIKKVHRAKKNTSYYYDKINYNELDIVINPKIVEPAVQFLYTLKVQYVLPHKRTSNGTQPTLPIKISVGN